MFGKKILLTCCVLSVFNEPVIGMDTITLDGNATKLKEKLCCMCPSLTDENYKEIADKIISKICADFYTASNKRVDGYFFIDDGKIFNRCICATTESVDIDTEHGSFTINLSKPMKVAKVMGSTYESFKTSCICVEMEYGHVSDIKPVEPSLVDKKTEDFSKQKARRLKKRSLRREMGLVKGKSASDILD